jgi:nucleobase transporter 1/2
VKNRRNTNTGSFILSGANPNGAWPFVLGIQQYLTMFGATVLIPFIVGGAMGLPPDQLALMISTIFFTSGLCTLIQQSPLGNKLPVIQGGTFSFLGPTFAILGLCTAELATSAGLPLWQLKIQMVAGAIMVASVVEIVLGYTGIMGQVRKIISPIVIGPTIAMIGLALFGIGAPWMATNWIISLITLIALILYSQVFSHKSKVFMLFPVLLAIATGWLDFPAGNHHRTHPRRQCRQPGRQTGPDRLGPMDQLHAHDAL